MLSMLYREKYPPGAKSEEELCYWFQANHRKLEKDASVVESWNPLKRCRFLAGYCLGFSSDFTFDSIERLIPPGLLNLPIPYLEDVTEIWGPFRQETAITIAVKAQNFKMAEILLDMNASLEIKLWSLGSDYLTDAPDEVRKKFFQLFCEKRGKTEVWYDSSLHYGKFGVGHLLAALQLSPNVVDEWTPEVCAKVVEQLWWRREDRVVEIERELLAIIYASGKVSIDDDLPKSRFRGWISLEGDLYRRQLLGLKFIHRTLNADPNILLDVETRENVLLGVFADQTFDEIFEDTDDSAALELFELVFCELMTPRLKTSVLIKWLDRFMNQILTAPYHNHPPNHIKLAVQRIMSLRHHNPGISEDLTRLLNNYVPRLLAQEEAENRRQFPLEHQNQMHYDQSQVFILWKVMQASVPSAQTFAHVIFHSAYLTFARLVWMFGNDCPVYDVMFYAGVPPEPEDVDGEAVLREKRCIEAFVRIMLRSTKKSSAWFWFLKKLLVKKGVSTDSLLKERMRLENMAAAAWNDCIRKHPRNVKLPTNLPRIFLAEKEFKILEKFGMEY